MYQIDRCVYMCVCIDIYVCVWIDVCGVCMYVCGVCMYV